MSVSNVEIYNGYDLYGKGATLIGWGKGTASAANHPDFAHFMREHGYTTTTISIEGDVETIVKPPMAKEDIEFLGKQCVETLIDNPLTEGVIVEHEGQTLQVRDNTRLFRGSLFQLGQE
jgi:hypothetical protein